MEHLKLSRDQARIVRLVANYPHDYFCGFRAESLVDAVAEVAALADVAADSHELAAAALELELVSVSELEFAVWSV